MIKNRKHGHIGLATNDVEKDAKWYEDVLGFEVIGDFKGNDGSPVKFLKNRDIVYEMYQANPPLGPEAAGKIDHYCFDSSDIEADYQYWENGVRYFKIASPTGEQLEFCQIL